MAEHDLTAGTSRFAAAARECGYRSMQALPPRSGDRTIGVLSLLDIETGPMDDDQVDLAQALADVATAGIPHHREIEQQGQVTSQLRTALTSRVVIEQARGVLAERGGLSMDDAFARLRGYARARLSALIAAHHKAEGRTCLRVVAAGRATRRPLALTGVDTCLSVHGTKAHALSTPLDHTQTRSA